MLRLLSLLPLALFACAPAADRPPSSTATPADDGGSLISFGTTVDGSGAADAYQASCTAPIATASGQVTGTRESESGTCVWRGIPYAAPPVGALRWRPPQPPASWGGVRQATSWGPICMQQGVMDPINFDPSGKQDEDCLYLNIWRPDRPGKLPVMVWVHGGAYTGGTGNTPLYWGDRLARDGDVVVVTLNYRLGAFGFLAHPALRAEEASQTTGNYGSLDQIAALKWVQTNIAAFGGDPAQVTLFGESAGGWTVCTLMASPLANGLFQRAILESGACDMSEPLADGYAQTDAFAQSLGCADSDAASELACLRKVPAKTLLTYTAGVLRSLDYRNHHDGHVLTDVPLKVIRSGSFNKVPLIAGHNKGEFRFVSNVIPANVATLPAIYNLYLKMFIGDPLGLDAQALTDLYALYPAASYGYKPIDAISAIISETALSCPTYLGAMSVAKQTGQVWFYRFDFEQAKVNLLFNWYLPMGAAHGMEIAFAFGNTDRKPASLALEKLDASELAKLSRTMMGYWTAFAAGAAPAGASLPTWDPLDPSAPAAQILDTQVRPDPLDQGAQSFHSRCLFWDRVAPGGGVLAKLL